MKGATGLALRSELAWFAERMEQKLRANDHKRHWRELEFEMLVVGLVEELDELTDAIGERDTEAIIDECVDVANRAMMLADLLAGVAEQIPRKRIFSPEVDKP